MTKFKITIEPDNKDRIVPILSLAEFIDSDDDMPELDISDFLSNMVFLLDKFDTYIGSVEEFASYVYEGERNKWEALQRRFLTIATSLQESLSLSDDELMELRSKVLGSKKSA